MDEEVYDEASWHYPEGEGCPSEEAAKAHIRSVLDWLKKNDLLNDYGIEIWELEVDLDTSITSFMLTDKGNRVIEAAYGEWLGAVEYGTVYDMTILDNALAGLR